MAHRGSRKSFYSHLVEHDSGIQYIGTFTEVLWAGITVDIILTKKMHNNNMINTISEQIFALAEQYIYYILLNEWTEVL